LATLQIDRARSWWFEHRDKAPLAFDDDLDELIERLEDQPRLVGRPVEQRSPVRRVYLRRIRYHVFFRIADDDAFVDVVALWHGSRRDMPKLQ